MHKSRDTTTLADRVKRTRKERGLTQQRLGELIDSNQASIQKIENGKSLRPRNIVELAKALRVSPSWLMFGHASVEEFFAEELDAEALEMADAWSKLAEPHRSSIKQAILNVAWRSQRHDRYNGGED